MRGIVILISAVALSGCAAPLVVPGSGDAIRISYFRYSPDYRTGGMVPQYRVWLSESWYQEHQQFAREPLSKVFRKPFLAPRVKDLWMHELVGKFFAAGFDALPHRDPKKIDLRSLAELHKSGDIARMTAHRIISVRRGDYSKTVLYADLLASNLRDALDPKLNRMFEACERAMSRYMSLCVQVTKGPSPFNPIKR